MSTTERRNFQRFRTSIESSLRFLFASLPSWGFRGRSAKFTACSMRHRTHSRFIGSPQSSVSGPGSTSKGLRLLRQLGAIRVIYKPGDRRDHYAAEIAVKMLLIGYLREKVEPHLIASFQNLESLDETFVHCSPLHREFYRQRIDLLIDTHHQAREFLPFIYQSLG